MPRNAPSDSFLKAGRSLGTGCLAVAIVLLVTGAASRPAAPEAICTVLWDGGAATNSWHDAANWSNDTLPGPADHVCITDTTPDVTVTLSQAVTTQILSLSSDEAVALTGGTLLLTDDENASAVVGYSQSGGVLGGAGDLILLGPSTWTGGTMDGSGSTTVDTSDPVTIAGPALKQLTGVRVFAVATGSSVVWSDGDLSLSGGSTLAVHGTFEMATGASILAGTGGGLLAVTGTFVKTSAAPGGEVQVPVFNPGTIEVQAGTALELTDSLQNFSAGTLTGGTFDLAGVLAFPGANVTSNASTLILDGAGWGIQDENSADGMAALATNTASGSLTVKNGASLSSSSSLANAGAVTVGASGSLTPQSYTQTAGTTTLAASTATLGPTVGSVSVSGGVLQGVGVVASDLVNAATVRPGLSAGVLTVSGDYVQMSGGTLEAEIAGTAPGSQYDRLVTTGSASLSGTLKLVTGSFLPRVADSFSILSASTRTGEFSRIDGWFVAGGMRYAAPFQATAVTLTALPPEGGSVSGDFNGDGFDDLAVGVPAEDIQALADAGSVHVLYGSASGLTDAGSQVWDQNSPNITDTVEALDRFGTAVAAGDLNGDGFDDLVVGVPGENRGAIDSGVVHVIFGSAAGLTSAGDQLWHQDTAGVLDKAEVGDSFGASVAVGDFGGGPEDDLAIGVPGEDVGSVVDAGGVNVLYGSAAGPTATGDQFWHQNTTGVDDKAEAGDVFGWSMAAGDLGNGMQEDLAVGIPGESIGTRAHAGAAAVLYGAAGGLSVTGNQLWSQNTTGILDSSEPEDGMGLAVAVGDLNGDTFGDLAVGVPQENVGSVLDAGALSVVYGGASGLTASGNQAWDQGSAGILDDPEAGDRFGTSVAASDLGNGGEADIVVGVPGEEVSGLAGAGASAVLFGSPSGTTDVGNQLWSQDSTGILDLAETGDGLGASVAVGDFNGDGLADAALGVPAEDVGAIVDAGQLAVLYATASGLGDVGNQAWNQDSAGIGEVAETGDRFGSAVG